MLFDGFTVCAQLLNFLLLVWLLKRFLYRPVLEAIDTREKLIAAQLQDAEHQKTAAGEERHEFQRKNESFEEQRVSLLSAATEEVKRERLRMLEQARQEADALRAGLAQKLNHERKAWQREIIHRTQDEVLAIAHQVLQDLANASLEAQIVDVLVRRIRELDSETQAKLVAHSREATHPLLVRSAFELRPAQQDTIRSAIDATLGIAREIQFETSPEIVCGIELLLDGHKVAWSIADYLASVEQNLGELLPEEPASHVEEHAATTTVG